MRGAQQPGHPGPLLPPRPPPPGAGPSAGGVPSFPVLSRDRAGGGCCFPAAASAAGAGPSSGGLSRYGAIICWLQLFSPLVTGPVWAAGHVLESPRVPGAIGEWGRRLCLSCAGLTPPAPGPARRLRPCRPGEQEQAQRARPTVSRGRSQALRLSRRAGWVVTMLWVLWVRLCCAVGVAPFRLYFFFFFFGVAAAVG